LDVSGSAAVPLGFDPAFESDSAEGGGDGDLRAQLKVFACGAETPIVTNSFDVTVLPVQALSLGGPYQVNQGDALEVSASGDVAPEFGGVSYVEWDTDGDGLYEPTTRVDFDPPLAAISGTLAEGTSVLIDTTEQQAFLVKARFGLASGEVREAQASVEVLDVTPTCLPPQLFVAGSLALSVPIGEDADFDASSTLPGHESDPIISYEWSFGDGASNTVPTPVISHRYLAEGEYTVTFTAHDIDSSCAAPVTFTVRVTGAEPIVENIGLAQPNAPRVEGQPITFSAGDTRAGSSSDPLIEYVWTFGYLSDGQLVEARGAQLEEPAHTYEDDGSYQVCLSVSDSDDTTPPSCFTVEVSDLEPSATFTGPSQSTEGQEVTFNATGTLAGGPSDQLTALRWDFGDGSPIVTTPPDQLTVSHTFISDSGEGTFNVTLTALDEDSEVRTSRSITVLDVRPTANFVIELPLGVLSADEGVAVTLNASASAPGAPSDQITQYHWDFGDGSEPLTTQNPTVSYAWPDGPRDYGVTLTVEDSDGSLAVSEQNISVLNVAPVVSVTASDLEPEVGTPLTFTLNVEDVVGDLPESSDRPVVIEWDFGDDTTYTTPSVSYTFESEGPKTVRVRYVDGDAGEAEAELSLNVAPRPATINDPVISVIDINGDEVADPRAPLGEFSDVTPSPSALFLREGESLTFAVRVDAAQLSTGAFDRVNAIWSVSPEGSEATYTALNGGDASLEARLDWTPSFFQAGQYLVRLAAEGEVTGSSVSREWRVYVAEAGTPMLAATTGNQRRGRVLFYSYGRENSRLSFTPSREVEVGMGAVDLVFDEQRARLFVSSPGSSHVAVLGGDPVRVLRNIPTGEAPYDLAWGGGYVWVSEAGARSVSALSPITLKRTRALELPNTVSPQSVVWVGAEDGASSPHLIVGDARNGTLTLINALEMLAGNGASSIKATLELGTSLTRIVKADGRVYLADGKRRVIYAANISELINEPSVDRFALFDAVPFAPQDLTVTEDGLWVATGSALWRLDPLTGEATRIDQEVARLIPADPLSLGVNGLVLSDGARLENVVVEDDTLTPLVGVDGTRVQRMASFLSRAEAP
jgi:PKD repeat protein